MRQQPVRPLSALFAILSVVFVIGIAMQFLQGEPVRDVSSNPETALASSSGSPAAVTPASVEGISH